jgi:tubulin-folding cofactor B
LNEEDRTLGYYSPKEGYNIHCLDLDPNSITKDLEDVSKVEKYVMKDEDYDKLPDSFRKFKENHLKNNPDLKKNTKPKPEKKDENFMKEDAQKFEIGKRCQLLQPGKPRGEIAYVGPAPEVSEGWFVGVKLDEPFGNSNGTVKGTQYFECLDNYGSFLRPDKVEQGNFPELDFDSEDEI